MNKAVLFGVLNWGLGHATRSIPIIKSLLNVGHKLVICSDGDALILLKKEFPEALFVELPGYKVRYDYRNMVLNMVRYSVGMLKAIHKEEKILQDLVKQYDPAYIISDNRYGFHHQAVKSILITHQLNIPSRKKWQSVTANKFLHQFINRFDLCWIPDWENDPNLSGQLSHNVSLSIPTRFIGPLSRFKILNNDYVYDLAFILSGPEPQRSKLESLILAQKHLLKAKCCLVRGTNTAAKESVERVDNLEIFDLLQSDALVQIISKSKQVVSRAGYTTIMDLVALQKQAVLVPTPGQPEQEYLAEHLSSQFPSFSFMSQDNFSIEEINLEQEDWSGDAQVPLWTDAKLQTLLTTDA